MITHIRTTGFKGFDFDEDIPRKAIYTGSNASGKSARAEVIALVLYGHVPFSTAGKLPSDVLHSFGKDEIVGAATIDGTEFARRIYRNEKGGASRSFQIDKKRTDEQSFATRLGEKGNPKIADIVTFMKLSEAKKVDTLFDLYPNPELKNIDPEIEQAKAEISDINKKVLGAKLTIQSLVNSKNNLELPPGTIAETQAEIAAIDRQIAETQEQIKQAEIKKAQLETERIAEKEKRKALEQAEIEKDAAIAEAIRKEKEQAESEQDEIPLKTDDDRKSPDIDSIPDSPEMREADRFISKIEEQIEKTDRFISDAEKQTIEIPKTDRIEDSIKRIIDALTGTGCSTCAALIVAKQELKKARRKL